MSTKSKKQPSNFDEAFAELQSILAELEEQEDLTLEEVSQRVRRSAELVQHCRDRLRSVDEELSGLMDELEE